MNTPHPPKWAERFLEWFCREDLREAVRGDLEELFIRNHKKYGNRKASWLFIWHVILFFQPFAIKKNSSYTAPNHYAMFRNYMKVAWRNMAKQKLYSTINILGLAVGMAAFILIFLYIQHELSYDKFYLKSDRIYRVFMQQPGNQYLGSDYFALTPAPLASTLIREVPEVSVATSVRRLTALITKDQKHIYERGLLADENFFEVFSHSLIEGTPENALKLKESIILTESAASRLFGAESPLNQSVILQNKDTYLVTGVIADPPANSSFQYDYITSILSYPQYEQDMKRETWNSNSFYTFFVLSENSTTQYLLPKLMEIHDKYVDYGENFPFESSYHLQALRDIHLETKLNFDIGLRGNPRYIKLFVLIAILVLFIACVNYINLAIARAIKRTNEVGLRKVIGAKRSQIFTQFLGESILISFLALLLALGLAYFLVPIFGQFMDRDIELDLLSNQYVLPGLVLLALLTGIFSGAYPALIVSALQPNSIFKGNRSSFFSGKRLQRFLTVFQYSLSIVLIISSLMIYQQFRFIQDKDLGYNTEHVITVPVMDSDLRANFDNLKEQWLANPKIMAVSASIALPTYIDSQSLINKLNQKDEQEILIYRESVDYDYLNVFGVELIAGRFFSRDFVSDSGENFVLNETAVKALGWTPEEAVGKQFFRNGPANIIGVVKDFHMHSMHMKIQPFMMRLRKDYFSFISVKVRPENLNETINFLEQSYRGYTPYPFEYQFLEERFARLYKTDFKLGQLLGFFTALSILIASMGLFGLAAFMGKQRAKEIGIRKVLGASVSKIVSMLSMDFVRLFLIGFIIAIPISWYAMDQWLQGFAYRIPIQWWVFLTGGFMALLIALFTVSTQSFKAATTNPMESIKEEATSF